MTTSVAAPEICAPWFSSGAARLGVFVLVVLSLAIGYDYFDRQGETQLAYVTVAAEIIAFSGLVMVRYLWKPQRGWALIALVLTLLAGAWCGLTMYEKVAADSRARAVEAAQSTLAYRTAAREFEASSAALSTKLAESPPTGMGPQTMTAWEASQAASVARLTRARDAAEARLTAAIPPSQVDVFAIVRGVGVELIKLLGFAAFGLLTPLATTAPSPARTPRQSFWRKGLAWFGMATMGLGFAGASHAATPAPVATSEPATPAPVAGNVLTIDAKTRAFSLYDTGAYTGQGWADRLAADVGVHRATVYRWIAKREARAA